MTDFPTYDGCGMRNVPANAASAASSPLKLKKLPASKLFLKHFLQDFERVGKHHTEVQSSTAGAFSKVVRKKKALKKKSQVPIFSATNVIFVTISTV